MREDRNDSEALDRVREEGFYERATIEINQGRRREGLWLKALTMTSGDEDKAKLKYVELLVQAFKDEERISGGHENHRPLDRVSDASHPASKKKQGLIKRIALWALLLFASLGAFDVMSRLVAGYVRLIDMVAVLFWALVIQFALKRLFPK